MITAGRVSRRRLLAGGVSTAAGLLVAACGTSAKPAARSGAATAAPQRPARLRLSWWTDTGLPSPFAFSSLGPGGVVKVSLLFDSLLWKDQNGLVPSLATAWEVPGDGREVLFTVRQGATWHDGKPLTADDVAFSFGYYAAHPFSWLDTSVVTSARAIDDKIVSVQLARPFAPFLHDIAAVAPIVPRHIWDGVAEPVKLGAPNAVVGSGPYTLASYGEEQGAYQLKANARYFAGRPAFDEVTYEVVPTNQQPVVLQSDRVDGALALDFDVQARFRTGRYQVLATQPFSIGRLLFNVERPPFDRTEFRQAIAFALDRQQIGDRVVHGDVVVGHAGVIPPESPWYSAGVAQYPYNPGKASALLDVLGYSRTGSGLRQTPQGSPLRIQLLADASAQDPSLIQSMLAQVGICVDIVATDAKTRTERQKKLDYQMALLTHIGVGGDPDFLRLWYSGKAGNDFAQGNVLHDPAFDALAEQQASELDTKRRSALVAQMQRMLSEELPTLPLYHRRFYWIYNPNSWDRWFNTWSGIMTGIPLADNKLALLRP